jgi:hypothetical protein
MHADGPHRAPLVVADDRRLDLDVDAATGPRSRPHPELCGAAGFQQRIDPAPGVVAVEGHDLADRSAEGLAGRVAVQPFGGGVPDRHARRRTGADHGVAHRGDEGRVVALRAGVAHRAQRPAGARGGAWDGVDARRAARPTHRTVTRVFGGWEPTPASAPRSARVRSGHPPEDRPRETTVPKIVASPGDRFLTAAAASRP